MSDPKKIFGLIPKVMAEVGPIKKDGFNSFDKYKFRSVDDVYNKLQPVLSKHGVFFVPEVLESTEEKFSSQKGTSQVRIKLKVKYHIFADDGSTICSVVEGEAIDRGDKATNKALTAAFKYMLIQVFCIAVEGQDDGDKDSPRIGGDDEGETLTFTKAPPKKDPPKETKSEAPSDFIIPHGEFEGQNMWDIPTDELKAYVTKISSALKQSGKKEQAWFKKIREFVE